MNQLPTDKTARRQLWNELGAASPELMADINTLVKQFNGSKVVQITIGEREYGTGGGSVFPLDDQFIKERLTAAEQDKFYGRTPAPVATKKRVKR